MHNQTTLVDDPSRLVDLQRLIVANHARLCNYARMADKGKDVLIVNFDQRTRTLVSYSSCYTEAHAIVDDQRAEALERLHNLKAHYIILAYLHDKESRTHVCTVAALHFDGTSTSF